MWAVPLVQHLLDQVLALLKSKTNRPFVRLAAGVAIYLQLHLLLILGRKQLHLWAASVVVLWPASSSDSSAATLESCVPLATQLGKNWFGVHHALWLQHPRSITAQAAADDPSAHDTCPWLSWNVSGFTLWLRLDTSLLC